MERPGRSVLRCFPWWRGAAILAGAERDQGPGHRGRPGPGRKFTAAGRAAYCPMAAVAGRARTGGRRDAEVSAPDAVPAARSPAGHVAGLRRGGGGGGGRGAGAPARGGVGARRGWRPWAGPRPTGLGKLEVCPARLFQRSSPVMAPSSPPPLPPPEKPGPAPVFGQGWAGATPWRWLAGGLDSLRGDETGRLEFAGVWRARAPLPTVPQFPGWEASPLCRLCPIRTLPPTRGCRIGDPGCHPWAGPSPPRQVERLRHRGGSVQDAIVTSKARMRAQVL